MIQERLQELGLDLAEKHLTEIYEMAKSMSQASGKQPVPHGFPVFPSFIPADFRPPEPGVSLLIDIGGTSTKTGVRKVNQDRREVWETLFEVKNRDLQACKDERASFETYARLLCESVLSALSLSGLSAEDVDNIGVVWSNALFSRRVSDHFISGEMAPLHFYNKGEWFLDGLKEGDDIGRILAEVFACYKMKAKKFLIANDTPLTCKAARLASAGVVASTGVNGTLVQSLHDLGDSGNGTRIVCNAEMGSSFRFPSQWIGVADRLDEGRIADQVERMIGGAFLPKLFCSYIIALEELGERRLSELANGLRAKGEGMWLEFRGTDVGLILGEARDVARFVDRRTLSCRWSNELTALLRELGSALVVRAAKLASVVAFASIANQLGRMERLVISLDSRLAREMPLFWSTMRKEFYSRIEGQCEAELVLVEPLYTANGSISVPLRGAAAALDSL